jgi:hypothetical protein
MHAPLNRTPSIRSERTLKNSEDDVSTLRQPSPPPEQDDEGGEDGDYSSRMEDILGEDDEGADEDEDEEDGFLYEGEDAPPGAVGYRARLKDVLGPDADADETDLEEERMVEDELDSQFLYPGASVCSCYCLKVRLSSQTFCRTRFCRTIHHQLRHCRHPRQSHQVAFILRRRVIHHQLPRDLHFCIPLSHGYGHSCLRTASAFYPRRVSVQRSLKFKTALCYHQRRPTFLQYHRVTRLLAISTT